MDIYEQRRWEWALERTQVANAHLPPGGVAFTVEDFLGRGNRAERVQAAQLEASQTKWEEMMSKRAAQRETMAADKAARSGEGIPQWALDAKAADDRRKAMLDGGSNR